MSYSFTPLSNEELEAINLINEGFYDFEVQKATRKTSKSGNPMAELVLKIWDTEGKSHLIYDYLVFSSVPLNIRKVKHFCDAVGLEQEYKNGNLPEDLQFRAGKVHIGVEDERPNPAGGMFPRKNRVLDYVKKNDASIIQNSASIQKSTMEDFDDQIPF